MLPKPISFACFGLICRVLLVWGGLAPAEALGAGAAPEVMGVPIDFVLFAATLLGVALFHHHTLRVALSGAALNT